MPPSERAARELLAQDPAEMVAALRTLVEVESPSSQPAALHACAAAVAALGKELLGTEPAWLEVDGHPHLRWSWGTGRVLLLCHLDTVWPLGTLAGWPFSVAGDVASGPGAFDMKAGLVQGLYALAALGADGRDGVTLLVTSDEEIGSSTSRRLIEQAATGAAAALVLEPSAGEAGALKTVRKGVATYQVEIAGRAAHAGLEPERGVNALIELAHQALAVSRVADPAKGTTVTPTVASAGTTDNTVPAAALLRVDTRAATPDEQDRVDRELRALRPVLAGATVTVRRETSRPPLPASASAALFALAQRLAGELGLGPLEQATVGGGSDGNLTAGLGVPTLDGLGAVGGGAHALGEHVRVAAMPQRAALVAALVGALRRQ
jgi:glutamate carboxypeptidase